MGFSASVLGGTGLVGRFLVQALIEDPQCDIIHVLTRRETTWNSPKVQEHLIDFDKDSEYEKYIQGSVLFSCLGTTRRQAKSIKHHYLVDYHYQLKGAKAAVKNGLEHYVLVSSPWASIDSKNYYRKMKAELELAVKALEFKHISILKPNGLMGQRKQPRIGENFAMRLFIILSRWLPFLRPHTPIAAKKVAALMVWSYYTNASTTSKMLILERNALNNIQL